LLKRKYIGMDISDDAVNLARKRIENPIRTDSNLLKNGKDSYLNQDPEILKILKLIDATPVQRNKGIDGFLNIDDSAKPIPIKIQRFGETIEKAQELLLNASSKNKFKIKILVLTNSNHEVSLFGNTTKGTPSDLFMFENIKDFIKNKKRITTAL